MTRLVVKSHRPWQFALAVIILSMFMSVLTWLMLDYSHWSVIEDRLSMNKDYKLLWEVNQGLEEENAQLRKRVFMLEETTGLDKKTAALLQGEITELQDEIHRLKGELEFYQGIMESTRNAGGLNIYGVHVTQLSTERAYSLRLVLTHVVRGDRVAEGKVRVSIEGLSAGETPKRFGLNQLTGDKTPELMEFSFKNFKRIESSLTLPEGFEPQRVVVEIQPKGNNQSVISKVFEWPSIAS